MSNFSPFYLGCPLCSTSLLSPLPQLILQNWRMSWSARVGFCCRCVCDSAVIKCSAWARVDVLNSHVDISMLLLRSVLSLMGDIPGGSLNKASQPPPTVWADITTPSLQCMEHVFGLICCGVIVFIYQSKDKAENVSSRNFSPDIPHL